MLMRPSARLMAIGYSFSDAHINDAIMDAIKQGDLKIFLIDPARAPRSPIILGRCLRPSLHA
jgi:hypothetical protein